MLFPVLRFRGYALVCSGGNVVAGGGSIDREADEGSVDGLPDIGEVLYELGSSTITPDEDPKEVIVLLVVNVDE